jgi:hypothetical protein
MPIEITCNLSKKQFTVKKVCPIAEMPKNVIYFYTVFFEVIPNYPYSGKQDIYINNSGYYATPAKHLKINNSI